MKPSAQPRAPAATSPKAPAGSRGRTKARAYTIARGEGLEAFAALETAAIAGDADQADVERCLPIAGRLYALLTGLIR